MGSITYSFLADSILFHQKSLENDFKNESVDRIETELEAYRAFCIQNYRQLIDEIKNKKSSLKVLSSTEDIGIRLLTQTALYIEQFIIPDPLFRFTDKQSEIGKVTAKYLGYQDPSLDKIKLTSAAKFLKDITPMIVSDYVKIFPLSYHFEAPKALTISMPENYNNGLLPDAIRDFFWDNAEIKSMSKHPDGGWKIEKSLHPCRGIIIDYKESSKRSGMLYHLFEIKVLDSDENTGKLEIAHTLPDYPPDMEQFKGWVTQSLNSASKRYFDEVFFENVIAQDLNATYLTDNPFTAKLISESFESKDSISNYTANSLLNIDLPFIDTIDVEKLMAVRNGDSDVFANFRAELEKQFRELRTLTGEKTIQLKIDNIFHELNDVQGHRIKTKVEGLNKQFGLNALLGAAGLLGSIHTSGYSLLATTAAVAKGYKDYAEYKEKVKDNPAYFLWQVKKKKK